MRGDSAQSPQDAPQAIAAWALTRGAALRPCAHASVSMHSGIGPFLFGGSSQSKTVDAFKPIPLPRHAADAPN